MKIKILSDLHFDFHQDKGKAFVSSLNNDCDVLCIAGDLAVPDMLEDGLRMLCNRFKQVVFVLGNHDLWGSSFSNVFNMLDKLGGKLKNLHWLENREVEIEGQKFIGATLWFERQIDSLKYKYFLPDFELIKDFEKIVFEKFNVSRSFFETKADENCIVITHHMPSYKCVSNYFLGSKYNIYFANNMDAMIRKNKPKIFISGHTHSSYSFILGQTKLICNPFGYAKTTLNSDFNDHLIIDTESDDRIA